MTYTTKRSYDEEQMHEVSHANMHLLKKMISSPVVRGIECAGRLGDVEAFPLLHRELRR